VVGRLVEQQQLGLAHQLARDGEAFLPAARERPRLLRGVHESCLAHRHGHPPVHLVGVEPLVVERLAQHGVDGRGRGEGRILRHVADAQAFPSGSRSGRGRKGSGQDLQ